MKENGLTAGRAGVWRLPGFAAEYARRYGARHAWARLRETGADVVFGWLAPVFGRHQARVAAPGDARHIVFLSGNEWGLRAQRPQHLAAGLARLGRVVHYVAPTSCPSRHSGWRARRLAGGLWHVRLFSRRLHLLKEANGGEGLAASLAAYLAPLPTERTLILVQQPMWNRFLPAACPPVFYDCIDDHRDFADVPAGTAEVEAALVARARGVIFTAAPLAERFALPPGRWSIVRNGCDFAHFARPFPQKKAPA